MLRLSALKCLLKVKGAEVSSVISPAVYNSTLWGLKLELDRQWKCYCLLAVVLVNAVAENYVEKRHIALKSALFPWCERGKGNTTGYNEKQRYSISSCCDLFWRCLSSLLLISLGQ